MKRIVHAAILIFSPFIFQQSSYASTHLEHVYIIKEIVEDAECSLHSQEHHKFKHLIHKLEKAADHEDVLEYREDLIWLRNLLHFLEEFNISLSKLPKKGLSRFMYIMHQFSNGCGLIIKSGVWFVPIIGYGLFQLSDIGEETRENCANVNLAMGAAILLGCGFFGLKTLNEKGKAIFRFHNGFKLINDHFKKQAAHRVMEVILKHEL